MLFHVAFNSDGQLLDFIHDTVGAVHGLLFVWREFFFQTFLNFFNFLGLFKSFLYFNFGLNKMNKISNGIS